MWGVALRWLYAGLATLHLILVLAGALDRNLAWNDGSAKALNSYSALTGADSQYAFFAPGLGSQLRIVPQALTADGETIPLALPTKLGKEGALRYENLVNRFWGENGKEAVRRRLSGNLAKRWFAVTPSAARVVVQLDRFDLPSRAKFREGTRAAWLPHYRATFRRSSVK